MAWFWLRYPATCIATSSNKPLSVNGVFWPDISCQMNEFLMTMIHY